MPIFLYTDIEGSTQLWEKHGAIMGAVLGGHDNILLECLERYDGRLVKHTGDGMFAVFENDRAPVMACALAMQRGLAAEEWGAVDELRIRIALHAGPAEERGGDYFGPVINRIARLLATAWGGQILLTPEVVETSPIPEESSLQDLGMHLFKDLTEPQQVYSLVDPGLPLQEFPAIRSLSSRPNNLPRQPTPLVGREEELAEISELLARDDCRLLTLVAPGGMGKTRLGLQAAADQIDAFKHGAFFVPLAGVTSIENLPAAIADGLNFTFYGAENLESQLHNYLREKEMLLLLDNFEHLIAGCGIVANILTEAPGVKIVATSRERLRIRAEWAFDVGGLSVPENGDAAAAAASAAVELFTMRAQRVLPGFEPLSAELAPIARLCRLVQGMPLAIELAAAWMDTLSPQEIVREIEQSLDLLETEMHDVPERQRSITAVFAHSWNDLSDGQQSAFQKMSVFRGGFDRAAAIKVTGATIRIISELINKSLLTRDEAGRYQVHELVRQFAADKLAGDEEEKAAADERHAAFFAAFLKAREAILIRGARGAPVEEISVELDNIRHGWRWAIANQDPDLIVDYMRSLFWFYEARAWYSEGEEAFSLAAGSLEVEEEGDTPALLHTGLRVRQAWFAARLSRHGEARSIQPPDYDIFFEAEDLECHWIAAGVDTNINYGLGNYETALRNLERFDEQYERVHNYRQTWPWSKAQSLSNMGRASGALGDYEKAKRLLREGVDMLRPLGDHVSVMLYLHTLGGVMRILGETGEARQLFQEGLELAGEHAYPMGEALAHSDLGGLAFVEGAYEQAKIYFQSSLTLYKEIGDRRGRGLALYNLGRVETAIGEYAEAMQLYEQVLSITSESGNRRGVAVVMNGLSEVYRLTGDLDRAEALCRESRGICRELGYRKGTVLAQISLGQVTLAQGDIKKAKRLFRESLDTSEAIGFVSGVVRSRIGLGRAALGMGETAAAEQELHSALALAGESHMLRMQLNSLQAVAELLIAQGKRERAVELLAQTAEHPAAGKHTKDRSIQLLSDLRAEFSSEEFDALAASGRQQALDDLLAMLARKRN